MVSRRKPLSAYSALFTIPRVLGIVFVLTACANSSRSPSPEKNELFTLEYGSFEDEINMFNPSGENNFDTYIAMRDGFFYISNGAQKKVMQFNSYGDLLSFLYNPETNPAPGSASSARQFPASSGAQTGAGEERREITTQWAIPYPFESPGQLAVDSRKNVYVVDTLPAARIEREPRSNLRLAQVVARFSDSGVFVDYLGQRGPGGAPFPWIQNIYTTRDNELVVVCRTNSGMNVYWFSTTGFLRYMVAIENSKLPNPLKETANVFMSLEKIVPDYSRPVVYLKIDYYINVIDMAAKVLSGIDYKGTYIYPMDVKSGVFLEPVNVPQFDYEESKHHAKINYGASYDFLGVTDSGWLFFCIPDETGYAIQMIQRSNQTVFKRHLDIDTGRVLYSTLSLADNGILSAMLADERGVSVAWWRTDSVIDALLN
jgi:hypothetical protein